MADTTSYKLSGTAVAKLADMWRESQRDNPGPPTPDGLRTRRQDQWFYAKITGGGPGVYQWTRQFLESGDPVTFVDAGGDYAQTGTATNLADLFASQPALDPGDYCIVRWDYDLSTPNPKPRYLINQMGQEACIVKILQPASAASGGMYDGVVLYGPAADPGTGKIIMPEQMIEDPANQNVVSCLVMHLNENNYSGFRAAHSKTSTQTCAYGIGFFAGMSTEATPRPIVMCCGLIGDDSNPLSIPNGTGLSGAPGGGPNTTTWDFTTAGQGALPTLMTAMGYGTTSGGSPTPVLWWNTRDYRWDAMGAMRYIHAEQQNQITMTWLTVVTGFTDDGSGNITATTTQIPVFGTQAGSPITVLSYGDCTTG